MAQFDVFHNPGRQRLLIPYVVELENSRYDQAATRFVAALVAHSRLRIEAHWLAPSFSIAGQLIILDVFNLATIPASRLGHPMALLAGEEHRVKLVRALEEFLSQA